MNSLSIFLFPSLSLSLFQNLSLAQTHAYTHMHGKWGDDERTEWMIQQTTYITKAQMRSLIIMTMNAMWEQQCETSLINFTPDVCGYGSFKLSKRSLFFSFILLCFFFCFLFVPKEMQTKPAKWDEAFWERLYWETRATLVGFYFSVFLYFCIVIHTYIRELESSIWTWMWILNFFLSIEFAVVDLSMWIRLDRF